jgi:hypothetical protein
MMTKVPVLKSREQEHWKRSILWLEMIGLLGGKVEFKLSERVRESRKWDLRVNMVFVFYISAWK